MTEAHPEIIIIKRHSAHEEEHHGGAWKIAFADFMTAMMAFFLVLWIISATDKNTKTLIARYFQSSESRGAGEGAKRHPRRAGKRRGLRAWRRDGRPKRGQAFPRPRRRRWGQSQRKFFEWAQAERTSAPANPVAAAAVRSSETLSDNVGAGIVPRSAREPRQDRWRAAARGPALIASAALKGYGEVGPKR